MKVRGAGIGRSVMLAAAFAAASVGAVGCGSEGGDSSPGTSASTDDITSLDQTAVKRQSIGNCWLYATSSWLESLHRSAVTQEVDTSESWLTYWHWYEQITNGDIDDAIETGGSYATAAELITRYGIMLEKDFIPEEANVEMSGRQSIALNAINYVLKQGSLKEPRARKDRALVRKELDAAWRLVPEVTARMDAVFGADVSKTIDRAYRETKPGNTVIRAADFEARVHDPQTGQASVGTLADALGSVGSYGARQGKFAWQYAYYPIDTASRRGFWKRVQKALHAGEPVIVGWKVDFNALTSDSRFSLDQLKEKGPGSQGGHLTVAHDYEATEVPGFGTLKAGEPANEAQMKAALADQTKISFLRVKNSWGGIRPDRWSSAAIAGYHDLETPYLNGPIKQCANKADGTTDTSNCTTEMTPLAYVVLPAGN